MLWYHQNTLSLQQIRLACQHLPHCGRTRSSCATASITGTAQTNYPSLHSQERKNVLNSCSNTDKCNQRTDVDVSWSVQQNWLHARCSQTIGQQKFTSIYIDAPRKNPVALKDYIKEELNNIVKNKIRKVTEPTDWVSSLTFWEFA